MMSYDVSRLRATFAWAFGFGITPCHTEEAHFYKREDTGRVVSSVTTKLGFVAKPYLQTWYVKMAVEHIRENLDRLLAGDQGVLAEASGAAVRSRDTSAEIGTSAHDAFDRNLSRWIETGVRPGSAVEDLNAICEAKGVTPRGEEIAACRSFDRFLDENEIIPLASEIKVWYEEGKDCYAGSVDAIFLHLKVHKGREGSKGCGVEEGSTGNARHDYSEQESGIWWCTCGREVEPKLILGDHKTSNAIRGKDDYALQSVAYAVAIEKETGLKFDDIWVMRYGKTRAEYKVYAVTDRKQSWHEFIGISRAYDRKKERGENVSLLEPLITKQVIRI